MSNSYNKNYTNYNQLHRLQRPLANKCSFSIRKKFKSNKKRKQLYCCLLINKYRIKATGAQQGEGDPRC